MATRRIVVDRTEVVCAASDAQIMEAVSRKLNPLEYVRCWFVDGPVNRIVFIIDSMSVPA